MQGTTHVLPPALDIQRLYRSVQLAAGRAVCVHPRSGVEEAVKIGELKYRIQIQNHDGTKDSSGTLAESGWQEFWNCWGAKKDLGGREYLRSLEIGADITTEFTVRYRADITAKMRVVCNGLTYDIESVADKNGNGWELSLLTKRRDA